MIEIPQIKIAYQDGEYFFVRFTNGNRLKFSKKQMDQFRLTHPEITIGSVRELEPEKEEILWRSKWSNK